jgi:hypothetical protein
MVRYIAEQLVFLCMNFVCYVIPLESFGKNVFAHFIVITLPSRAGIHRLIKEVRSTISLLVEETCSKYLEITEEKLDEVGANLHKRLLSRNYQHPKRRSSEFQPIYLV